MTFSLGVDVGGTFTDLYLYDSDTTRSWSAKTPSTPSNQSVGVITGLHEICARAGIEPQRLNAVLHGTTVATNALLERTGSSVGLLTSYGWSNILHLADSWTPGPLFGFFSYQPPLPVVPLERIRALHERIAADGEVLLEIDDDDVKRAVSSLIDAGIEALTICLHHSYAHPEHERRVGAIASEVLASAGLDIPVSLSSDVSPEFREYERAVTTVLNSYLGPVMRRYLSTLEGSLRELPVPASLRVVRSDGGLMSLASTQKHPVATALSGPSGGVNGASFVAARAGFGKIITFDMGGTSSDIAVCIGGAPTITRETKVGSFPVRAPAISVETIGAGGGSIADISEITGSLRVGPGSAGAEPGPACYGRGGDRPTVSDANLIVGHLPPTLLGGQMSLDLDAAKRAFEPLARELGVEIPKAAQAVIDIVNGNMLGALRVATIQKGLNPRDYALLSFGGAGGLHANALAADLGSYPLVVPPEPGVLSALGFVVADVRNEFASPRIATLTDLPVEGLRADLRLLEESARRWLDEEEVPPDAQSVSYVLDMRYRRQGYEIPVDWDADLLVSDLAAVAERFHQEHQRTYGFVLPAEIELVTIRARAHGVTEKVALDAHVMGPADSSSGVVATQRSWQDDGYKDVAVYDRALLRPGMTIVGKAVVAQYDSTVLVLPGHIAVVDEFLNLIIDRRSET